MYIYGIHHAPHATLLKSTKLDTKKYWQLFRSLAGLPRTHKVNRPIHASWKAGAATLHPILKTPKFY